MPGVVSVLPNLKRKLHTTHSWDFMGLHTNEGLEITGYSTKDQENVIIGFIDTGTISLLIFKLFFSIQNDQHREKSLFLPSLLAHQ